MFHISYYLHESNDNYIVTLHDFPQTISLLPHFFRRELNISQIIVVGCREIDFKTAQALGFIVSQTGSIQNIQFC
ncbi:hypothetical protein ACFOQM_08385 [Paenibacillus sp. GCM10012307]|uniref:Uncharacterized protein n=1 Tax=Paenibacillus roseus TaxID=2798579 RepID=A0A934J4D4_9BACL|nr:hypothetical protein [Paenibacillus roseus]MBJ6361308.1 hypothetical protein [Paenibacillus roseus]